MNFQLHPDLQRDGIVIGSFPLSLLLLINDSNYPWFVLVPQRPDILDTIDLKPDDYQALWLESAELSRAIRQVFAGEKLNIAALGNITPQLHVHHIVRYSHDAAWPAPIWGKHPFRPYCQDDILKIRDQLFQANIKDLQFSSLSQC
jgi:diadenosine tetraphosphate (Ap4A) HIT family hydrolase